jgi:hypothetical protein
MKKFRIYILMALITFMLLPSCSEEISINLNEDIEEKMPSTPDFESFVSSEQASEVATAFFNKTTTRNNGAIVQKTIASMETIKENDKPLMYIINYANGGFIIIGATRNYYPVLAYSEENTFILNEKMYALLSWMEDTKEEIKESDTQGDDTLFERRNMWRHYETEHIDTDSTISGTTLRSTMEEYIAFGNRRIELRNQYYDYGYMYYRLSDLEYANLLPMDALNCLFNTAEAIGSPPYFTIVGVRSEYHSNQIGPLLTTNWHQNSPYNSAIPNPNLDAGCGPVAMAQIMNFHKYPHQLTYNGILINWNTMPNNATNISNAGSVPHLIAAAGMALWTIYTQWGSAVLPGQVDNGFRKFLYNASNKSYNHQDVINEIGRRRPVMMYGSRNTVNITNSHYWVCDGVKTATSSTYYFAEFRIGGPGNYNYINPGGATGCNPHEVGYSSVGFHMNWGWGVNGGNGWYSGANSPNGNYQHHRRNFLVHP